ncbi:sodium-dependent phosphate transport protein 2B-like [Saccoglossus kowalevskii]|uniref:Sodium-dependent phosphate transport protein 2B-like n=1 Tax=Saccoglossus kowalevskii TaxID=10224 RepID=A0ABM0H133_SACKO|nr:PREDICTED: sodium-dependent phosphate transport protein 2B-like [Saccoglossus kowalevskii]
MLQFNLDEANGVPLFISPFPVESKIPIEPGDLANVDKVKEVDHWALPELQDNSTKWADLSCSGKLKRVIVDYFGKLVCLIGLLYLFICSLSFLGSAFRLLGGKAAGEAFASNEVLSNPVCGLMIGVLATVLVQSSSTTTSIVVSMVAAEILYVRQAIPIVMGANIGTSVTNTLVAMFQAHDRNEFRRAFAGATVHDVFNWLSVICLLPLEITTGYLYKLSGVIVRSMNLESNEDAKVELIKIITKPFTSKIIEVDKKVITKIAIGDSSAIDDSMIKHWCETTEVTRLINVTMETNVTSEMSIPNASSETMNVTTLQNITSLVEVTDKIPLTKCSHLFVDTELSDTIVGIILLAGALAMLCICLVLIVKLLHSLLRGQIAIVIKRTINADFPGKLSWLTGYIAILVGAGLTLLVQSSSIFTSALTPLIGIGVVSLDRAYPLTLGANIGTTGTGLLAAMASSDGKLASALQIAFCHLLFNISGILIWYPIPCMRKVPIRVAKIFGNTTAKYRWFAGLYLVLMFFLLPGLVFALSVAGWQYLVAFGVPILTIATLAILISVLQVKAPKCLPHFLRTWDFLPKWMHSLEPFDRVVNRMFSCCRKCPCCKKSRKSNSYDVSHISQIPLQDCNTTLDSIKITSV